MLVGASSLVHPLGSTQPNAATLSRPNVGPMPYRLKKKDFRSVTLQNREGLLKTLAWT